MFSDNSKKSPLSGVVTPDNPSAPSEKIAETAQLSRDTALPKKVLPQNSKALDLPSGSLPALPGIHRKEVLMKSSAGKSSTSSLIAAGSSQSATPVSSATGLQFTLSVNGLPPKTFSVVDFTLHESFSSPWLLQSSLASEDSSVSFESVLDNDVTLSVWRDGELQRSVKGIVATFEQGDTGFHQTRYSMTIRPEIWRTSLRSNSRIFQQQSPEEIISTLLRERGVLNVAFSLRNSHPSREFCVQYQEDDLSFIHRLSAEEGMYYYFEPGKQGDTLVFADDAGSLPSGPALPWNPNPQAQSRELSINTLSRSVQVRPASVELKDYTFKNPRWHGKFTEQARQLHNQRQDYEYYAFPGRFKDDQRGQDFTRYHLDGLRNDADAGQGKSNAFQLTPGVLFTLNAHPRADLNTRWQLVSVTHRGQQPQALEQESGEQGTLLYNEFSFIPAHQTWRPAPLPKPKMDGSQIALVVGPPGEEIYCDNFGRVRVQFPWDRDAKGDDTSSCWIRVSQPWAGQGWGMVATPRIGQEVVVDFLHGDPDQPIIIGRTYHANNLPSIGLPAAKTQMAFRSKTHKGEGYNELKFEDANGKEELSMHAQKDMNTKVNNDRDTNVGNNHSENVGNDQSQKIGNDQTIHVANDQSITIGNNQTQKIGNDQNEDIGNNQVLMVKNDRTVTVKNNHNETVKQNQVINIDQNQTVTVKQDQSTTIKGGQTVDITKARQVTVKDNDILTVTNDIQIKSESGDVVISNGGGASITLTAGGDVLIKGTAIQIESSAQISMKGEPIQLNE